MPATHFTKSYSPRSMMIRVDAPFSQLPISLEYFFSDYIKIIEYAYLRRQKVIQMKCQAFHNVNDNVDYYLFDDDELLISLIFARADNNLASEDAFNKCHRFCYCIYLRQNMRSYRRATSYLYAQRLRIEIKAAKSYCIDEAHAAPVCAWRASQPF